MKKKYYKFSLNMITANILSVIPLILAAIIFSMLPSSITSTYSMNEFPYFLPLLLIYFLIHELLHGLGYRVFAKDKNNIKYGAKLEGGVFYAMCQERINKKSILISLSLPLIVLTILVLPIAILIKNATLLFLAIANLSGAVGDIIMIIAILRMPDDIEYIDYDSQIGAYLLSNHDLSKKKYIGFKFIESGKDSDELINKSIKKITISKFSWVVIAYMILLSIVEIILS